MYDNLFLMLTVNLLWFFFSLPVVTLPFTTLSLFWITRKIAKKEKTRAKDFLKGIKVFAKEALALELFLFIFLIFPLFNILVVSNYIGGKAGSVIFVFSFFVFMVSFTVSLYFLPLWVAGNGALDSFKYAVFFIRDNVFFSFWLIIETVIALFIFGISGLGIVLLMGSGGALFLNNTFLEVFSKYEKEKPVNYQEYEQRSLKEIYLFWQQ